MLSKLVALTGALGLLVFAVTLTAALIIALIFGAARLVGGLDDSTDGQGAMPAISDERFEPSD